MRKLLNRKGSVKLLSVLLSAGLLVTGLSITPKADENDPDYQAWAYANGDDYEDDDSDGVDDTYEEFLRQQAAAEQAAAEQAEQERIAAEQAAAEEAARQQAEQAAAEQKALEEAAARAEQERIAAQQAAAEEAARKAAEEAAAQKTKRDTPQAQLDILNNRRIVNIPDNSYISANGANWAAASGTYYLSDDQYEGIKSLVKSQNYVEIKIVALDYDGDHDYDSDVQTLTVTSSDFPSEAKTKRETPNAKFEASTSVLSNLGSDAKYSVDGGMTWSVDITSGSTTVNNVHQDMEIRVVNPARLDTELDSDIQIIWIEKSDTPTNVVGNPVTTIGGTGSLVNVNSDEEYCVSGTNNWKSINGSTVDGLDPGKYDVRVKAHGNYLASDIYTVTIDSYTSKKADKPNAAFNGASLDLYQVSVGMAYTIDGSNWVTITDNAATHVTFTRDQIEKAVHGNGIQIKKLGDGKTTTDSDIQQILVTEASKPSNVTTTAATNGNNGQLCNVASDMQYSTNGTSWTDIGSNTVSGLSAGNYYVRRKAAGTMIASENVTVTISSGSTPKSKESMPSASFNAWNMTLSDCNGCQVSYDGGDNYSDKFDKNEVVLDESRIRTDKGLYVRRAGNGTTADSDAQHISLSKQAIPTGITAVSATANSLGMINGVNNMIEYRAANSSGWLTASGNTITGLAAGTYYLRTKGAHTAMPSDYIAVVIQTTAAQTVVQPTTTPQIVVVPKATPTPTPSANTNNNTTTDKAKLEEAEKEAEAAAVDAQKAEEAAEAAEAASEAAQAGSGEPSLLSDSSVKGWGAIEGQMSSDKTDPIVVDLTKSATVVPATTIAAAATTNTELILDVSSDMAWSIQPSQILSASQDIDLGINENTADIPAEKLATVETEGVVEKQFTINHDGDFGFTANLTVQLNAADAGKTAKLFWYNTSTGDMELVDYAVINEYGEATFAMTHASSYAVCVNTAVASATASEDNTAAETSESVETAKKSSNAWIFIVIALIVLIGAVVIAVILKKNHDEEVRRRHHMQQNHPNGIHHTDATHHTEGTHHTTR